MARTHLTAWRALGVPTLVWSTSGADALVSAVGHGEVVPTLDALLVASVVVDVCTPTPSHPDLVRRAAHAGCHVICEKPLARSAAVAQQLVETCRRAGVQLHVAHVVRWFGPYAAARRRIASGELGVVTSLELSRRVARPEQGWFADPGRSGGVLLDLMVHDLDAARWLAGEAVEVVARERETSGSEAAAPGEMTTEVEVRQTGGAVSRVVGTWGPPGTPFATAFRVAGTAGVVEHRSDDPDPTAGDPYLEQLRDFLVALTTGVEPRVTPADAVAAVVLAEAAERSIALREPVAVAPTTTAPPV